MSHRIIAGAIVVLAAVLSAGFIGTGSPPVAGARQATPVAGTPCPTTTPEENEALVRRHIEIRFDETQLDAYDELLTSDYIHHRTMGQEVWQNPEEFKESLRRVQAAFDASDITIEAMLSDESMVGAAWTTQLTFTGEYLGAQPTGQTANWEAVNLFRIECGRIAETWSIGDTFGLFRQLEIITDDELATVGTPTP
jgi:steroid delta-isomerase-like uncharacterized protein